MNTNTPHPEARTAIRRTPWFVLLLALGLAALGGGLLYAAAPLAGTTIGNAASATYKDAASQDRQVTSNTVITTVQQVYSFTLDTDRSVSVVAGAQVSFPHVVTNTGNGTDSYTLTVANNASGDTFDLNNLAIYADTNKDGLPDNTTNLAGTSVAIDANQTYGFVVVGAAPGTVTTGNAQVTVTATAAATQTPQSRTNTDTATATTDAVVQVTKSISSASGPSTFTGPLTYTLTFHNIGNTAAASVTLVDTIPTGMTYVASSATWSGSASALTDAAGGDPVGISFDYNSTTPGAVTYVLTALNPGGSGTVTFQVNVTAGLPPQTINNAALYSYDPDGAGGSGQTSAVSTNVVPYVITQGTGVEIGDTTVTSDLEGETAPTGGGLVGTVATANPGATVAFVNRVRNTGNGTDSFDITVPSNTFASGTAFFLFKSDGNTPLVDNSGNGVPDTGPLAPGATYDIVVKAILPTSGNGTSPVTATIKAVSATNVTIDNTTVDTLTTTSTLTVDLTNNVSAGAPGTAPGEGAYTIGDPAAVTTATNPGTTVSFTYFVYNPNTVPDTYDIAVSNAYGSITALPTGWTAVITDPATGGVISNTGVVAASSAKEFTIAVTIPAYYQPGAVSVFVRAMSPTTGTTDWILDTVTVNTVRELQLTPNHSAQIYPGGVVTYTHTLKNNGNVLEGAGGVSTVALTAVDSLAGSGWNTIIYSDTNANGVLDAADTPVTDLSFVSGAGAGLAVGESVTLFAKVFAPLGSPNLAIDTMTLTATTTNGSYSTTVPAAAVATDTTTVVVGDLSIQKTQVLDVNCDNSENGYAITPITSGAVPGACVKYRIIVTNAGSGSATTVVVYDVVPAYTALQASTARLNGSATGVTVTGNNLEFAVGTLAPGATATCEFAVKINQ